MGENDGERRAVIHGYYQIYRQLQKRNDLREYSHFDIYGNNRIEIWEYAGERRRKCVCKVKEDSEIECYKRATEELKNYGKESGGMTHEKRAG